MEAVVEVVVAVTVVTVVAVVTVALALALSVALLLVPRSCDSKGNSGWGFVGGKMPNLLLLLPAENDEDAFAAACSRSNATALMLSRGGVLDEDVDKTIFFFFFKKNKL